MNTTLEAMRELANQIFAETDCAECPTPEVRRTRAMVPVLPKLNGQRWGERPRVPRRGLKPPPKPRAGEVRLVDFINAEVARCSISKQRIYARLMAGKYVGVKIRRPAARVTFVSGALKQSELLMVNAAQPGEMTMKQFVIQESERLGTSERAIYVRLNRRKYPDLEFRRVNQRVVFVKRKEILE